MEINKHIAAIGYGTGILLKRIKQYMIQNFTTRVYIQEQIKNKNLTRNCRFVFITSLSPIAKGVGVAANHMSNDKGRQKQNLLYECNGTLLSFKKEAISNMPYNMDNP